MAMVYFNLSVVTAYRQTVLRYLVQSGNGYSVCCFVASFSLLFLPMKGNQLGALNVSMENGTVSTTVGSWLHDDFLRILIA